eukprot:519745_1
MKPLSLFALRYVLYVATILAVLHAAAPTVNCDSDCKIEYHVVYNPARDDKASLSLTFTKHDKIFIGGEAFFEYTGSKPKQFVKIEGGGLHNGGDVNRVLTPAWSAGHTISVHGVLGINLFYAAAEPQPPKVKCVPDSECTIEYDAVMDKPMPSHLTHKLENGEEIEITDKAYCVKLDKVNFIKCEVEASEEGVDDKAVTKALKSAWSGDEIIVIRPEVSAESLLSIVSDDLYEILEPKSILNKKIEEKKEPVPPHFTTPGKSTYAFK